MNSLNIKKGDKVIVIAGNDKLTGKDKFKPDAAHIVMSADPAKHRVIVQNVHVVKRATRPRRQGDPGGIIQKEAPIDVSNVMLVCPKCGKPTRVGYTIEGEGKDKKKYRVCKRKACGKRID